jgi:stage V sporulation protein G
MEITDVRVKLVRDKDERVKAFCSMTLDDELVIRDIKVIEGTSGYFVAMPSRKMSDHCPRCGNKNHLKARFCNRCGVLLPGGPPRKDSKGRLKLHADIAHPITAACRQSIQEAVVTAFKTELSRSKQPGYKPMDLDEPENGTDDAPS